MHSILPFLLAMIVAIVLLEMLATKLRIAYPILLVIAGLLISFIPGLPAIKIDPTLIFFIFLPPLLNEAAWGVSFKEMRKWWRIISSFAFLVVFFTALSVAIVVNHYIPGFSIALGFLLGGIVSPPDAISTAAITKFVKIPKSTTAILEGESLLNDASSLLILRFALIAVGTGQFVWSEAALGFVWMIVGGVGIGLGLGWLFTKMHKLLPTDAPSDIALTLVEPYFLYWVAEHFESSGVLAVVCGGLYMSNRRMTFLNSQSRIRAYGVWESFVFVLNGIVFFIIGLDLPDIVAGIRADGVPMRTAIGYSVLVTIVLIVARMISSYAAMLATIIFRPSVRPAARSRRQLFIMPLILGWTGMRGVVSLAAALSIPVLMENGQPFPHRSLILFITFVVILLTLVVQGLTLPYFIKRSKVFEVRQDDNEESTKQKVKHGLKQHIYQFLKDKYDNGYQNHIGIQKMLQHWEERSKASNDDWMDEKTKEVFLEMLDSQREYLLALNKDPNINEGAIRKQLYQLDLEEERLRMLG